ncbi:glycoside hydrolase family 53 protein [Ancylomarina sp. YFZ004]
MKNFLLLLVICLSSCSTKDIGTEDVFEQDKMFIQGADLSALPEIRSYNTIFYNADEVAEDALTTLKNNGVNVVRLKLWHTPINEHASLLEVKTFAKEIKRMGMKVWLTVHYSDTWADPGQQVVPAKWKGISFSSLKDSVYAYTRKITQEIKPDYIQIGNEINSGILFPYGKLEGGSEPLKDFLSEGIRAVRESSDDTQIMLHFAGLENSDWFFNEMKTLDYDIIALSYYPLWHGKDFDALSNKIGLLGEKYKKPIVIAETAYPFTLEWNDFTNNILGSEDQLILPDFPASPLGQKAFLMKIRQIMESNNHGIGFCYWGGELVAFKGKQAKDASPWENQALYDFKQTALPVLDVFKEK